MTILRRTFWSLIFAAVAIGTSHGADNSRRLSRFAPAASSFEVATIHLEKDLTDGNTEIVVTAKPNSQDGLVSLKVISPAGERVFYTHASGVSSGIQEFKLESAEAEAILDTYPEGDYSFFARTTEGELFFASPELHHALPTAATITYPPADLVVATTPLTIQWSSPPGNNELRIELKNRSAHGRQVLVSMLPGTANTFQVPLNLLSSNSDYEFQLWTLAESGNAVGDAVEFSTGEQIPHD